MVEEAEEGKEEEKDAKGGEDASSKAEEERVRKESAVTSPVALAWSLHTTHPIRPIFSEKRAET